MTGDERQPRPRRLSTWTTRRWLRVGVAASLVVLALLGVAGALVMGRTQSISNNLTDVRSPSLSTAFRLETALVNQETGIRGYGLTGIPDFLGPYRQGLVDQKAHARSLEELLHGDRARLDDLKAVREAVDRWQEKIARPIAAAPPGSPPRWLRNRWPGAKPPSTTFAPPWRASRRGCARTAFRPERTCSPR